MKFQSQISSEISYAGYVFFFGLFFFVYLACVLLSQAMYCLISDTSFPLYTFLHFLIADVFWCTCVFLGD